MSFRQRLSHIKNALVAAPLAYRPGHYYSPICDPRELKLQPFNAPIEGVDLNHDGQLERWQKWQSQNNSEFEWSLYSPNNSFYVQGDAICLANFLRELKPKRYIEIGNGFSSACALDTIESCDLGTDCLFIDPYPTRLRYPLGSHRSIKARVQDVPLTVFDQLEQGDILFIDSTHILKTGSDLHYELFHILPRLRPGVFIHFHDVFYPFEYPPEWVIEQNRSWNEAYALRALLHETKRYKIEFWNNYLSKIGIADFGNGASLWLSITSSIQSATSTTTRAA